MEASERYRVNCSKNSRVVDVPLRQSTSSEGTAPPAYLGRQPIFQTKDWLWKDGFGHESARRRFQTMNF
jgi:hypothetical protein